MHALLAVALAAGPAAAPELPPTQSGWLLKAQPLNDRTDRFVELYQRASLGEDVLPRESHELVFMTVQGLFGWRLPRYMEVNENALRSRGLDVRRAPVNTHGGLEENARILRYQLQLIAAEGKKVVLIGHSMGGLDATAALALYPELRSHVRAVVTLQSPYAGTPLATDIEASKLRPVVNAVLTSVMGGETEAVSDLAYEARRAFIAAHPFPKEIPIVSLGSSFSEGASVVKQTMNYMKETYGLESDGLVPELDSYVPGSQAVRLTGLDHASSTMPELFSRSKWKAEPLTLAAIALALEGKPGAVAAADAAPAPQQATAAAKDAAPVNPRAAIKPSAKRAAAVVPVSAANASSRSAATTTRSAAGVAGGR